MPLKGGAACYVISAYFWDSSQKDYRDKTISFPDKIEEWSYCMGKVPIYLLADFNQNLQAISAFHTVQLFGWRDFLMEAYDRAEKPCPPT